ncbi:alpha/beta fold hydrolase [Bacillus sp. FJAT-49736]|nr:alpha/beta fold hydrolase [Bacillus sp. FJAT-49736]MBS4171714.1 alpha/beta fold hydrolase [Bacillus sp. FJAT-49736]
MANINVTKEFLRWKGFFSHWTDNEVMQQHTPREAIWKKNKATLWYYPASQKKYKKPLFLIYSLVNQPFILDLLPNESVIQSFVKSGFDVYLLDFGIPGNEDSDITVDHYIVDYIQRGVNRALHHSNAEKISIVGYCLGGTLATVYTAISNEPVENLILMVAPIDFQHFPSYDQWLEALREGYINVDDFIDAYGIVPAEFVKFGVRLLTSPVYLSHYLSLLNRSDDPNYVLRWRLFNKWTIEHIPFAGAAMKQLINDFVKENKLIKGGLIIRGQKVHLSDIKANLLVVSSNLDHLVPKEQSMPIIDLVSSQDKTYKLLQGGHTHLIAKGNKLPDYLEEWLPQRSDPL